MYNYRKEGSELIFFDSNRKSTAEPYPAKTRGTLPSEAIQNRRTTPPRRMAIVEPVNGRIKNRDLRRFILKGPEKVVGKWQLIATQG